MEHTWTEEQKEALGLSISHHEENLNRLKEWDGEGIQIIRIGQRWDSWEGDMAAKSIYFDSGHCNLCKRYLISRPNKCGRCPLSIVRNECDNNANSAWKKLLRAVGNAEIIAAETNMVAVLKDTLSAGVEQPVFKVGSWVVFLDTEGTPDREGIHYVWKVFTNNYSNGNGNDYIYWDKKWDWKNNYIHEFRLATPDEIREHAEKQKESDLRKQDKTQKLEERQELLRLELEALKIKIEEIKNR